MKISAIIEARMTSSRLPGKVLMKPNNKTFFEILVKRLRYVKELSSIILATTINKTDDELVKKAKNLKLKVFRGSEHHVVNRVLNAAKKFKAEIILGITADCPLIDPDIVSNTIQMYLKNDVDYVSNGHIRSFPDGMDCQVFSLKILKESYALIKTELEKEHLGLVIRNNIKKFRKITLIAPNSEIFMLGDEVRIHQVIANLLANARTHTPDGTPIAVMITSTDTAVSISVADQGPGMSDVDQKRIFERFYRADSSRTRSGEDGTGLGLSIVEAVMRAHDGTVSVESELGKGSKFTLTFPRTES